MNDKEQAEAAALERIQQAHQDLDDVKANVAQLRKDIKDRNDQSKEALKISVERGIPAGAPDNAIAVKLQNIELAWQDYCDAQDEAKMLRAQARDALKAARSVLADAVKDSKQLTLPGV